MKGLKEFLPTVPFITYTTNLAVKYVCSISSLFHFFIYYFPYICRMYPRLFSIKKGHHYSTTNTTRHLENNNTPQEIDWGMNNLLLGPQVTNCNNFGLVHYLALWHGYMEYKTKYMKYMEWHGTTTGLNNPTAFQTSNYMQWRYTFCPKWYQIWQVFGLWAGPYEANWQMPMMLYSYRLRRFHKTLNGVYPSMFLSHGHTHIWDKWANGHGIAQLQVKTIP